MELKDICLRAKNVFEIHALFFFFRVHIFHGLSKYLSTESISKVFCTNISFSFQYFSMSFFKYLHDASCIPRFWVIQCRNMSSESVGACSPLLCWPCVWPAPEVGPEAGLSVTRAYRSVGCLGGQPASYNLGGDFEVRFGSWCVSWGRRPLSSLQVEEEGLVPQVFLSHLPGGSVCTTDAHSIPSTRSCLGSVQLRSPRVGTVITISPSPQASLIVNRTCCGGTAPLQSPHTCC